MRSMDAEAVLKHRVRDEQTSGKKNRCQKVLLFFNFFQPGHKFSGRSDKLLAAGVKGLKTCVGKIFLSCIVLKKFSYHCTQYLFYARGIHYLIS